MISHRLSRRDFFARSGAGFGLLALQDMLARGATTNPLAPKAPHFPARAKSVIWLFMNGGVSHVDTWDYKPELTRRDGKPLDGFDPKTGFFPGSVGPLMGSPFKWAQHGQSGTWGSDLFPTLAQHVDKMAFIHSCWTTSNNHSPALFKMNTGETRMGFPSAGSWVTYGLGSASDDLPAFIVMSDPKDRGLPKGNASNWTAGFLPSVYQGTWLKPKGEPIDNLKRLPGLSAQRQREQLDLLAKLNRAAIGGEALVPGAGGRAAGTAASTMDPVVESELAARIDSFELAYRMQTAAPETFDLSREPEHIKKLYGLDQPHCSHMAAQCLTARRLIERGTRFVQIYSGGMENQLSWDCHLDLIGNHSGFAREVDQPFAALLSDLAQRGMLDETLIVCAGEFGRLPISQKGAKPGRDHNPHAFTAWFAGGGIKGGTHHGESDDIGFKAVVDKVSVHDFHATILHALGIDHEKLIFPFQGLDHRLTGVEKSRVVKEIFA